METICLGNKIASNLKLIFYFIYNFLFFKTVPTQTNILTSLIQELVELIKVIGVWEKLLCFVEVLF